MTFTKEDAIQIIDESKKYLGKKILYKGQLYRFVYYEDSFDIENSHDDSKFVVTGKLEDSNGNITVESLDVIINLFQMQLHHQE